MEVRKACSAQMDETKIRAKLCKRQVQVQRRSCTYKASSRCKGYKSCLINLSHLILIAAKSKYPVWGWIPVLAQWDNGSIGGKGKWAQRVVLTRKIINPGQHLEIHGCQSARELCTLNILRCAGQLLTLKDCLAEMSLRTNWTSSEVLKVRLEGWNVIGHLMGNDWGLYSFTRCMQRTRLTSNAHLREALLTSLG